MRKPKILILLDSYLPGYKGGGPTRSIKNMIDHLSDEFDFMIITADRDLGDEQPYGDVLVDQWNTIENAQVYYASPRNLSLRRLARLIRTTPHEALYLNSFFHPVFVIKPLFANLWGGLGSGPTIIAPRGELLEGCLQISRWKKAPYLRLAKTLGVYRNLNWQASNELEAESIRKVIGSIANRVHLASNLLPVPREGNENGQPREPGAPFRICFLSRLTKEKNLDYALRILSRVKVPVIFDIYGPRQDEDYWKLCKSLIDIQVPPVQVRYQGNLEYNQVGDMFRRYDLFFFPTRGENFAHVIIEAMLVGTPVLLADTTPWRNLEAEGVGWDLPLENPDTFVRIITVAASMAAEQYREFRQRVRHYAVKVGLDPAVLNANRQLLLKFSKSS